MGIDKEIERGTGTERLKEREGERGDIFTY